MPRPLNELLSAAIADYQRDFTDAAGDRTLSLEMYSNLLRIIPDDGVAVRDIPKLACVSKRATKWNITVAQRMRWVVEANKRVELTEDGRRARDACERVVAAVDEEWRKRFGEGLRRPLEGVVRQLDLELPHHPRGYGPADGSVTGGVSGRWGRRRALRIKGLPGGIFDAGAEHEAAEAWEKESGGRLYVRETGQDWRPVPRGDGDTVSALPLLALLSQAFMAFAIDYEGCGGFALARSGNALHGFPDEGIDVALREAREKGTIKLVPVDYAGLERHAYAAVTPDPNDKKKGRLTLTEKGSAVRDAYDDVVAAIEDRWKRRYGADVVDQLRTALEGIGTTPAL